MSSAGQPQDLARHIYNALMSEYPLNDSAVRPLVAAVKALPPTRPEPAVGASDNFNLSFHAFKLLTQHLCSLSPTAKAWTESLMVQIIESLMAFVLYYVREIVLCGKIIDFRDIAGHDFHYVVIHVVQALTAHPFHDEGHPNSKAYGRALKIFLADIVPALLLTYDALDIPSSIVTERQISLFFAVIQRLHAPDDDPAWHDPLYRNFSQILDQNPAMNDVLASTFLIAANGFRVDLTRQQDSQAITAQNYRDTFLSVYFPYYFITHFIVKYEHLHYRLIQGGLTRTTCELFSAVARKAREAALALADTQDKEMALSSGGSTLEVLGMHIMLEFEGRVGVELALQFDVLYQMREFDRLLHELGSEIGNHDALASEFGSQQKLQNEFIQFVKPYLVYYDILEKVSRRLLNSECTRESPVWKSFAAEIESLEDNRTAFDKVYQESCQAPKCPHSYTVSPLQTALHRSPTRLSEDFDKLARAKSGDHFTVFRCAGCRLVYYCSKSCQQSDWQEHKSVCARVKLHRRNTGGVTDVPSRREITFIHTIACLTLSRHPPRDGLVRDMDFTTSSSPTLSLQSLNNPVYNDAKIVVGDEEIHKDVIRKRVLHYMRSLKQDAVGIVYNRQFLAEKGAEAVLTFVDWEMLDGKGLKYKRRG